MYKEAEGVPYYQQLKEMFIEQIENERLKAGDKIPSERDIAIKYNVSRMTARHAITHLEREGYVERRVGMGTFISKKKFRWNFIEVNSLTKSMQEKGLKPSTKILFMEQEEASAFLAETLDIRVGEKVISIRRLRLVDNVPIAIELSQIPYKYCEGIEEFMDDDISLYSVLAKQFGVKLVKQRQRMRIALSSSSESKLLKVQDNSPCLLIRGTTSDEEEKVIEYSQTFARGDLVEFYSETISSN